MELTRTELPTRTELLSLKVELDYAGTQRHLQSLKVLMPVMPSIKAGDTLKVNYYLFCHYFGDVEAKLREMNRLIEDEAAIVNCGTEELFYAESLIVNIVCRMRDIQRSIARRSLFTKRSSLVARFTFAFKNLFA